MSGESDQQKKIGRPRKYPGTEKRPTLTFRARDALYDKLKKSAIDGDRSISEEIEKRLESSFLLPDIEQIKKFEIEHYSAAAEIARIERMCGGRENFEFSWFIAEKLKLIRKKLGVGPDEAINDLPEDTRRQMVADLVALLPDRFGVWGEG